MTDRCETVRDYTNTIPLSFLKNLNLHAVSCDFYAYPNEEN